MSGRMYHLTIVCSSAILYDAVLRSVTCWNQQSYPHVTVMLSYMTLKEWEEKQKSGSIQGRVMLLEKLPWKRRLLGPSMEYEELGYGKKIGKAEGFEVILANPDKLLKSRLREAFYDHLSQYTNRSFKRADTILHSWLLYFLIAEAFMLLVRFPHLSILESILAAGLFLQRNYVKQLQCLYGTIIYIRSYLFLLPDMSKPADIQ